MGDPLEVYRRKRDFTRTPEPSGRVNLARGGASSWCSGTARAGCTTTCGSRSTACWSAGPCPRARPSTRTVRRLAMHVEDHPIEYLHFEGVIPSGEYGGGDVIVWDTGTWEPVKTDDPARGRRGRRAARRGARARSCGAGSCWCAADGERRRASDVDAAAQARRARRRRAGTPRNTRGRCSAAGPTSEVRGRPGPALALRRPGRRGRGVAAAGTAARRGDRRAREARQGGHLGGLRPPPEGHQPRQGAVPRRPAGDQARAARLRRPHRARSRCPTSRAGRSTCTATPTAPRRKGFWHKQRPDHAPEWLGGWDNPEADEGETTTYVVADEPAALVWAANFGALEWHPWTSRTDAPHEPTYALVDLDPGERTSWDDLLVLARLHRTALEHLGVTAGPKVTGRRGIQIWVPVVQGYSFDDTRAWVEALSQHRGQGGAGAGQLEVGGQGAQGAGPARLHAERDQQDAGRRRTPRDRRPARRCRCRSAGTSSTTPTCGRTAGRSAPSWTGWPRGATRSAPCSAPLRNCPRSGDHRLCRAGSGPPSSTGSPSSRPANRQATADAQAAAGRSAVCPAQSSRPSPVLAGLVVAVGRHQGEPAVDDVRCCR